MQVFGYPNFNGHCQVESVAETPKVLVKFVMSLNINPKLLFVGLGVVTFVCLALFGGMFAFVVLFDRQVANYPGSMQLSSHDVVKLSPHFYYRQETVFLTGDDFPSVQRWYSNGFGLGPEVQGQSNCNSMISTDTRSRITKVMTVTICDTANGRMIFVQRSVKMERR